MNRGKVFMFSIVFATSVTAIYGQGNVDTIVKRISAQWSHITTLQGNSSTTVSARINGVEQGEQAQLFLRFSLVRPGRFKCEIKNNFLDQILVFDGTWLWHYLPSRKEYTKRVFSPNLQDHRSLPDSLVTATQPDIMRWDLLSESIKTGKVLELEEIQVSNSSQPVRCYVIELSPDSTRDFAGPTSGGKSELSPMRIWVGIDDLLLKKMSFVVKSVDKQGHLFERIITTVYNELKTNQHVAAQEFVFKPPSDAREVNTINQGPIRVFPPR